MLIEEEVKGIDSEGDVNPDALAAVFEEEVIIEDEEDVLSQTGDPEDEEDADEIDIAFAANDEGYW